MAQRTYSAAGFLVAAALLIPPETAAAQTIRVGIVLSYTGPFAALSTQTEQGLSLYVKEHQRSLPAGIRLELIRRDDAGNPAAAAAAVAELVQRDRVDFLIGGTTSLGATAVARASAEAKIPFITVNASNEGLTRISPYVIRMSVTLPQMSQAIGIWAAKEGFKTAYTIVGDVAAGHDAETAFAKAYVEHGGKLIGSDRVDLRANLFEPFLQAKKLRPDILFASLPPGAPTAALVKSYDEIGLKSAGVRLVGPQDIASDSALADMGEGIRGLVTAGNYSSAADRPQNLAFVESWNRSYGDKVQPDFMAVAAWDGMAAIFDVIRQRRGKVSGEAAMDILRNWKNPNSPRGPMAINAATREPIQQIYIRRVEHVRGRLVNVEFETIRLNEGN